MSTEVPPAKKIKVEECVIVRPFSVFDSIILALVTRKPTEGGGLTVGLAVQYTTKTNELLEIRVPDTRYKMCENELQTKPMYVKTWKGISSTDDTVEMTVALTDLKATSCTWTFGIKFGDYYIHMGNFDPKNLTDVSKRCRVYKCGDEPLGTTTRITFRFGNASFST